jgi:hypothetical protein
MYDLLSKEFTNLDLYFNIQKRLHKRFVIPEIKRKNAGVWTGRSTARIREDFKNNIKSTQRDRKLYKLLILYLCKGEFQRIGKLI